MLGRCKNKSNNLNFPAIKRKYLIKTAQEDFVLVFKYSRQTTISFKKLQWLLNFLLRSVSI